MMKWKEFLQKNEPVRFNEFVSLLANETGFRKSDTRIFLKGFINVFRRLIMLEVPIAIGGFIKVGIINRRLSKNTVKNLPNAKDGLYKPAKQIVVRFPRSFRNSNPDDVGSLNFDETDDADNFEN